jgi:hypothetical protein
MNFQGRFILEFEVDAKKLNEILIYAPKNFNRLMDTSDPVILSVAPVNSLPIASSQWDSSVFWPEDQLVSGQNDMDMEVDQNNIENDVEDEDDEEYLLKMSLLVWKNSKKDFFW